jgi:hypothetical protein
MLSQVLGVAEGQMLKLAALVVIKLDAPVRLRDLL